MMYSCGIDIGSRSIKVVIFDGASITASVTLKTGIAPADTARTALNDLIEKNNLNHEAIKKVVVTGYGRNYFTGGDKVVSEIICHAAGVNYFFPYSNFIIEIGGQDSKVIRTDDKGRVADFVMNDRCAAGTGKFIEMVAGTLNYNLEETGSESLKADSICEISSMCAVFAESEIIGLLHKGVKREVILRGVFHSVAKRVIGLAGKINFGSEIIFTGGVARNIGIVEAIKNVTGKEVILPPEPLITGALGAAIIGYKEINK